MGTRLHLVGVVAVETAGVPSDPVELISESGVLVLGDAVVDAVVVGGVAPGFGDLACDVLAGEVAAGGAVAVTGVALEGGRSARGVDGARQQQWVVRKVHGAEGNGRFVGGTVFGVAFGAIAIEGRSVVQSIGPVVGGRADGVRNEIVGGRIESTPVNRWTCP